MSIIISQNGSNAKKINKSEIKKEDYLQNYIHNNPNAIPIYELKEDKKLLVLKREFNTNAGPIDALAIDKDGDIYIVETKLYKNPDKRTVVAQALDYGAALWRHFNDFSKFTQILNQEIESKFKISLEDKIKEFYDLDDDGLNFVLEKLKDNLNDGNIKFVILMDSIDERLKDLILYVNQNSQFDIYAVQLEYYKFEQYEIMVPKMFGVEVKKKIISTDSQRKKWTENDFLIDAQEKLSKENFEVVKKLFLFFKDYADDITLGTGTGVASINIKFNKFSIDRNIICFKSNGRLGFSLNWVAQTAVNNDQKDLLNNLKNKLKEIKIEINDDYDAYSSTWISVEELVLKVDDIIRIIKELI